MLHLLRKRIPPPSPPRVRTARFASADIPPADTALSAVSAASALGSTTLRRASTAATSRYSLAAGLPIPNARPPASARTSPTAPPYLRRTVCNTLRRNFCACARFACRRARGWSSPIPIIVPCHRVIGGNVRERVTEGALGQEIAFAGSASAIFPSRMRPGTGAAFPGVKQKGGPFEPPLMLFVTSSRGHGC